MIILLYCIVFIILSLWGIAWSVHISMTKSDNDINGWGNFNSFFKEYKKYDKWKIKKRWKYSFFGEESNYKIHADIIKFNNCGMLLDPISFIQFKIWSREEWMKLNPKKIKIWQ